MLIVIYHHDQMEMNSAYTHKKIDLTDLGSKKSNLSSYYEQQQIKTYNMTQSIQNSIPQKITHPTDQYQASSGSTPHGIPNICLKRSP